MSNRLLEGFAALLIVVPATQSAGVAATTEVRRFGVFEASLQHEGEEDNPYWEAEATALVEGHELTALVRREKANSLLFFSRDHGRTWSDPGEHNFPMESSKIYAGLLSTGQRYVLCNLPTSHRRALLVIAVSPPGRKAFSKMWKIRDGACQALRAGPEWSYPCAVEANGKLHVVYTSEKHHCVMTVIPVMSLSGSVSPSAAAPDT